MQRWAFSIGGSASHEAGHTYGLAHNDDFFQNPGGLSCNDGTDETKPGEDALTRHLMAQGCHFTDGQRAGFRRHFSDATFSILAANVGLSVETVHNWDFRNPNSAAASQLQLEVLSASPTLTTSWTYLGNLSPWTSPSVVGPIGTTTFKSTTYNRFHITWSTGQSWANGTSGNVPGGAQFHVGVAFSEADFTVPDSIIVVKVSLLDGGGNPLALQPRMISYDTGVLDASDGSYNVNFVNAEPSHPLLLGDVIVSELPRVASIDSMVSGAKLAERHGLPIRPWKTDKRLCEIKERDARAGCFVQLRDSQSIVVAKLAQGRHIVKKYDGKCNEGGGGRDSSKFPDINNCPLPGINVDLFPSTVVYVTATIIDPEAKHWDPATKTFVVGR